MNLRHLATRLSLALLVAGCSSERDLPDGESGIHPAGWVDEVSPEFHAVFLRDNGYPLSDCRACHGEDYEGGSVGIGCEGSDCHSGSIDRCGTCHGVDDDPLPATGAHAAHSGCETCHPVPQSVESAGHLDGLVDLAFTGLAAHDGAAPSWDGESCSGVYCHGAGRPVWGEPGRLGCDDCHAAPPTSHARFARVATESTCADCHADPVGTTHVDGALDLAEPACNACHGGTTAAPPLGLDGDTAPTAPSVGAHDRHLDPNLADRIGRTVPCARCHPVPDAVLSQAHLDDAAPADVALALGGSYDAASQDCVVWCHWDNDPGPTWTDASGGAMACDACHGFPPVTTRIGTPHPPSLPSQCGDCHSFSSDTHVDGEVDFQ